MVSPLEKPAPAVPQRGPPRYLDALCDSHMVSRTAYPPAGEDGYRSAKAPCQSRLGYSLAREVGEELEPARAPMEAGTSALEVPSARLVQAPRAFDVHPAFRRDLVLYARLHQSSWAALPRPHSRLPIRFLFPGGLSDPIPVRSNVRSAGSSHDKSFLRGTRPKRVRRKHSTTFGHQPNGICGNVGAESPSRSWIRSG